MNSDYEKRADDFLDDALGTYSTVEPRSGLEQRILANLRTQPWQRRRWLWALAPVAAILAAVLWLWPHVDKLSPVPPGAQAVRSEGATQAARVAGQPRAANRERRQDQRRRRVRVAGAQLPPASQRRIRDPRREKFPTAVPLTEQERLLMALAKNNPGVLQEVYQDQEEFEQQAMKNLDRQ